jgi:hypothetical protein
MISAIDGDSDVCGWEQKGKSDVGYMSSAFVRFLPDNSHKDTRLDLLRCIASSQCSGNGEDVCYER